MTLLQVQPRVAFLVSGAFFVVAALLALNARSGPQSDDGVYRIIGEVRNSGLYSTGTGFKVAEPGYVLTNHHVINGAGSVAVAYIDGADEPTTTDAEVVWFDSDKDLALLRTKDPIPGKVLTLADIGPQDLEKSTAVTAVGFPGAADAAASSLASGTWDIAALRRSALDATVSTGTVQRVVSTVQRVVIQHSANINPGNSGGPLLDACDRVVGVNTFRVSPNLGAGDLEFAVHSQEVVSGLEAASRRAPPGQNFSVTSRSGRCHAGYDNTELGMISLAFLLGGGAALTGLAGMRRNRGSFDGPAASAGDFPEIGGNRTSFGTIQLQEVDDPVLVLTSRTDGQVIGKIRLSSLDGEKGVVLGRAGAGTDLEIPDSSASRKHAVIRRIGGTAVIHDLKSTNGTQVDGVRVSETRGIPLTDGSIVRLGTFELVVATEDNWFLASSEDRMRPGATLLSGFDGKGNAIQHVIQHLDQIARQGQFKPLTSIGRDASNTLRLDSKSVSRRHAAIGVDEKGTLCVLDLGSSNGTVVDGREAGKKPVPIAGAKTIAFGDVVLSVSLLTN